MNITVAGIPVELVRKRMKNMYLRVKNDGRVTLSAPYRMPRKDIDAFLAAHADWLQRTYAEVQRRPQETPAHTATGETIYLWGAPYVLVVREVPGAAPHATKSGARLMLTVRPGTDAETRAAILKELLRAELSRAIAARLPVLEQRTGLHASEWRTKDMKTRWGTCNVRARRIWVNLRLVHHPKICLDYLLLHELLHLIETHHNAHFYALMTRYMPDWKAVRALLNR
ncbi:M48 family metallopeptidase [uncultured Selenomonas sp.]|uniref:M48 family metallopeptidase n=1 Tax=uncultured Selenomonas sp. TaxID=159275 RepID=UPI0025FD3DF3|nr:SprT family zinc-dependent metalloprotease [uncultured Selenomonas sp.]